MIWMYLCYLYIDSFGVKEQTGSIFKVMSVHTIVLCLPVQYSGCAKYEKLGITCTMYTVQCTCTCQVQL